MERNIHMDEFEDFLKEKADQYKLYPSDKAWNNINNSLHGRKKWPYITLTVLLLLGSAVFVDYHSSHSRLPLNKLFSRQFVSTIPSQNIISTAKTDLGSDTKLSLNTPVKKHGASEKIFTTQRVTSTTNEKSVSGLQISSDYSENDGADTKKSSLENELQINAPEINTLQAKSPLTTSNRSVPLVVMQKSVVNKKETAAEENAVIPKKLWGGEIYKRSKFNWQLSFSPTVSYRKLTSGINNITDVFRGIPYSADQKITSVNNMVTHKPAAGAEVGAHLIYKISDHFLLKTGLQLNYSRYQVKAYASKPELTTLSLGSAAGGTDSLNVVSTLRNFNGRGSSWYNNEYFQVSLPVGFEWSVLGNSTVRWNIAASAQPVYNFANNVYLLSTDFRNYAQDPSLIRKWNLNAGVETFISYDMGAFKLQAGPQLRYQLFSSYKTQYPIKEYLVDFGFKLGITKTIK